MIIRVILRARIAYLQMILSFVDILFISAHMYICATVPACFTTGLSYKKLKRTFI